MNTGVGDFDDAALQALDEYLNSDCAPENRLGLSDLDGFLTSQVVGPVLIMPNEWLPVVWGHEEPEFESLDQANSVMSAIFARYNEIIRQLEREDFAPLLWQGPEGQVIAADWCEGFMDGVRLRIDSWKALFQDAEGQRLLYPILALCSDEQGGNLLGLEEEPEDMVMGEVPDLIPACVEGIHRFWKDRAPQQMLPIYGAATVGRLASCACGSGKPYEECCGVN